MNLPVPSLLPHPCVLLLSGPTFRPVPQEPSVEICLNHQPFIQFVVITGTTNDASYKCSWPPHCLHGNAPLQLFFHKGRPTAGHYPARLGAKYFLSTENASHEKCKPCWLHHTVETHFRKTNLTPAFWVQLLPKSRDLSQQDAAAEISLP